MKPFLSLATVLPALMAAPLTFAPAQAVEIKLPAETASFKAGPGVEMANGQCLNCHSVEYVQTQPPFPRTFWAAEVKKMQQTYGAAIPDDQVEGLTDYLTRTYGIFTNAAPDSAPVIASKPAEGPARSLSGKEVATKYGCLGCHTIETKLVGPPYKDVAAKYGKDPEADAKIAEQIHKGGSGKWGSIIMPPFPQATPAETKALAAWILSFK